MSLLLLLVHCVRVCAVCGCGMVDIMTLRFVLTPSPFLPLCPPLGGSHLWFTLILSCLAPFPGVGFTRARLLSAWDIYCGYRGLPPPIVSFASCAVEPMPQTNNLLLLHAVISTLGSRRRLAKRPKP